MRTEQNSTFYGKCSSFSREVINAIYSGEEYANLATTLIDLFYAHAYIAHMMRYFSIIGETLHR